MQNKNIAKVLFIMEQHLGHISYYQNLRHFIDQSSDISPAWIPVTYDDPSSPWNRIPLIPKQLRGPLAGRYQVRYGLLQNDYDIAFFNTQVPAALSGNVVKKRPYVLCTDITPIQYDETATQYHHKADQPGFIRNYKYQLNKRLFQRAQRVLPWSNWASSSLIKDYGVSPNQIEVIPPGIDLERWHPVPKQNKSPKRPLRILFVGGDFYRKGGEILIRACEKLPPGLVELHLVTKLEIPSKNWVFVYNHLVPNSPDLLRLYQEADIFVLPTKAEAFGIAAVEAAAVGLPVIATAVGGLSDVVENQETGFLIPPYNEEQLLNHILILCEDPSLREKMGWAGRERAERFFDARKNTNRVVEILCKIAANYTPPS
jgi:glycosyltransferase involved in cell wall biosynthesis